MNTLPEKFSNLWHVAEDLFHVRITTKEWKEILLNELDRPFVRGQIRQLVGKKIGPGVYEITVEPEEKA